MLRPIVVGLDGSAESVAAADWAAREALRRGLPLRLVHAWEELPSADEPVSVDELRVPQYWSRRVLRSALDRLGERYPQVCVSAEQIHKPPVPALVAVAEDAELLVLGNRGFRGMGGFFAGSVAMAALAQVRRPVVLVRAGAVAADECVPDARGRPSEHTACRGVAVALDLKNECDALLDFAFDAARRRGAPLVVLYAWHLPDRPLGTRRQRVAAARREAEWVLTAVLEPWRAKYPTVEVRAQARRGRPGQEVVRAAREAGLLIVGRRIRRVPVGSHMGRVAHAAIQRARCPVAVVAHD